MGCTQGRAPDINDSCALVPSFSGDFEYATLSNRADGLYSEGSFLVF